MTAGQASQQLSRNRVCPYPDALDRLIPTLEDMTCEATALEGMLRAGMARGFDHQWLVRGVQHSALRHSLGSSICTPNSAGSTRQLEVRQDADWQHRRESAQSK